MSSEFTQPFRSTAGSWKGEEKSKPLTDFIRNPLRAAATAYQTIFELDHAQDLAKELAAKGISITQGYDKWLKIGLALAGFEEAGREIFHLISQINTNYVPKECDKQFDDCLSRYEPANDTKANFFHACREAGLDVNPRFEGREEEGPAQRQATTTSPSRLDPHIIRTIPYRAYKLYCDGKSLQEAVKTISSEKTILPDIVEDVIRPIFDNIDTSNEKFWNKGPQRVIIDKSKCLDFAVESGFYQLKGATGKVLFRVRQKVVEQVDRVELKHTFLDYIDSLPPAFDGILKSTLRAAWLSESSRICDNTFLENLPFLKKPFLKDNASTCYRFYLNGFVGITKSSINLKSYDELPGYIRQSQIIQRQFVSIEEKEVKEKSEYYQFCKKVVSGDEERFQVLIHAQGYLTHQFNPRTTPVAIILYDKEGRAGKGIIGQALSHINSVLKIDGRNADINNRFMLQRYTQGIGIIHIDDADPKRFPFGRFLTWLTEGFEVEQKNKGSVFVPFAEAPKFYITSNYVFEGTTASHAGRRVEIELDAFYSLSFTPAMDFGHLLFDDWDEEQWQLFDNTMLLFCQYYLTNGILRYKSVNMLREKLIQATCEDFVRWAEENLSDLAVGTAIDKTARWQEFRKSSSLTDRELPQSTFTRWLKTYLNGLGYGTKDGKSRGVHPRFEALIITGMPASGADKTSPSFDI
ncbi:hypothetical protein AAE02nite_18610 [Adhaeribacter aerolatus]|uniref:Primase C-terminal 2 domain-containing protein n=1 Tax=Adhaeribacter aerolatus TaxID=670289 RepID=A0A512AXF5_9BACT|nr:PriCT-2 domain-containing protein [Adhaeribacter aerolatus]GEO04197.1 hypothetical protein AAE02nite_18610 [Adhaeribacter aerolatus]